MDTTYRTIARALNVSLYESKGYVPKHSAQANLTGRTHYVDSGTLACFHSRIVSTHRLDDDSVFVIIESVAKDYENKTRGFRFVAFDLVGTVLNDPGEVYYRTSESARAAMWKWTETFNSLDHHRAVLTKRAESAERAAATMRSVAASV